MSHHNTYILDKPPHAVMYAIVTNMTWYEKQALAMYRAK